MNLVQKHPDQKNSIVTDTIGQSKHLSILKKASILGLALLGTMSGAEAAAHSGVIANQKGGVLSYHVDTTTQQLRMDTGSQYFDTDCGIFDLINGHLEKVEDIDTLGSVTFSENKRGIVTVSADLDGEHENLFMLNTDSGKVTIFDDEVYEINNVRALMSKNVRNGIDEETCAMDMIEDYIEEEESKETVEPNKGRRLGSASRSCAMKAAVDIYNQGKEIKTYCDGKVLSFKGSDDLQDWIGNVAAVADDFEWNYNNAKKNIASGTSLTKKYDYCVGHSLGGALAKLHNAKGNFCTNVITMGSPLTRRGNGKSNIEQFTKLEKSDCCRWRWWRCKQHDAYVDIVTELGSISGRHRNEKYVGRSGYCKTERPWAWDYLRSHDSGRYKSLLV